MLPRHRTSPPPQRSGAAQVQLHVRRVVLDAPQALGVSAADLPQALQQALAADLAGQQPPVNHLTPLHELARSVGGQVRPVLDRPAATGSDGGTA